MAGKKHERDGESFIVSEDVDLDQLDLENMVQNEVLVPEILKTQFARPPSIESIPGMIPKTQQAQERIWLEITLDVNGTLEQFPGYIEGQKISPYSKVWSLRMDREAVMGLMMLVTDTTTHSDKNAFCTQLKWVYGESEKVMELVPPTEFRMFEVEDESDSDLFVKVRFELTNH